MTAGFSLRATVGFMGLSRISSAIPPLPPVEFEPGDAARLVAFDIETRPLPSFASSRDAALNPSTSEVFMASFFGVSGAEVFEVSPGPAGLASEEDLLGEVVSYVEALPSGTVLVGWNSAGFDLPFLRARIAAAGLGESAPQLAPLNRLSRHGSPLYFGYWLGFRVVDVCDLLRAAASSYAESHPSSLVSSSLVSSSLVSSLEWGLKPTASELGLDPVTLDASQLSSYSPELRYAYSLSDARVTFQLATLVASLGPNAVVSQRLARPAA